MKSVFFGIAVFVAILYLGVCCYLFLFQEDFIFFPEKLNQDYRYTFENEFEEVTVQTKDGHSINGLLFKAPGSKGLIFYLHGNAGSLRSWGGVAKTYTQLNYDVFIIDYRGFGKSSGKIQSQEQFFEDVQTVYNSLLSSYPENRITILGYSVGTGAASYLAATNHPQRLILQAPYFSLKDMMKKTYPIIPTFLLKYRFETNEYIQKCKMPIVIFHGNQDEVIDYASSLRLKQFLKSTDTLITLNGQGHNGMTENLEYKTSLKEILK